MQKKPEHNSGRTVHISGVGTYIGKIDLFTNYCKVNIGGRIVILPIEMIAGISEEEDVNVNTENRSIGYDWKRYKSNCIEIQQGAGVARI